MCVHAIVYYEVSKSSIVYSYFVLTSATIAHLE